MKKVLAIAGALLLMAAAPMARAAESPLFRQFQTYCVATGASADAALSAVKADGFVRLPKAMLKEMGELPFDEMQVRGKLVDDAMIFAFVGNLTMPSAEGAPAMAFTVCGIATLPRDAASQAAFTSWVQVPPLRSDSADDEDSGPVYMFVDGPKGRRSLEDLTDREARRSLNDGAMRIASAMDISEDGSLLFYGVVKAAP